MSHPQHGYTRSGTPVHGRTELYIEGVSARLASRITGFVGTMQCAALFAIIALISLPAAISSGSVIVIVAWIAQTFLQLVLLSIIMVGQNAVSKAADARASKTLEDTEKIVDRLDAHTEGGIKTILDKLDTLRPPVIPVAAVRPRKVKP